MSIKVILDELANESGTNNKMKILEKYKTDELLKKVLYYGMSKRIKFYIKQIPEYTANPNILITLEEGLAELDKLSARVHTGTNAVNHLKSVLSFLDEDDAIVLEKIIKKKMGIGMGRTNLNKVLDPFIPESKTFIEKTPYMGAKSYSVKLVHALIEKANGEAMASDVKMDGRYCNAIIRGGEVEMESRQGEPTILDNAKFLSELEGLKDGVLNGELTIDGVPRYESNGIISSMIDITKKRKDRSLKATQKKIDAFEKKHGSFDGMLDRVRYTVWDTITVEEYYDNKSNTPYLIRRNELMSNIAGLEMVSLIESKLVYTFEDVMEHFQEMLNRGEEGTVLKLLTGAWKNGKPNWQIKCKLEMDIDLKIVGFNYGTGKNIDVISSFKCETECGLLKTKPTGIDEETMDYITENQDALLGTIIEVKCSGLSWNVDGEFSLLHPVFKMFRDDKDTANTLKEVKEIEEMAKGLSI